MLKYKLRRAPKRKIIIWSTLVLLFVVSIGSIVKFYAASTTFSSSYLSNITDDTVFVNDLIADRNYYEGLNFTEINNRHVLPGENTNKYNDNNLIAVQITYDGHDINNNDLVGRVSHSERQYKFVYYKYYYVENGKIKIELIDNPYSARPTGYGFNGWVCDTTSTDGVPCEDLTFSYDDDYYLRYITVDVPEVTENLVINLKASWTQANIAENINSASTINSKLYAKGMREIESAFNNEDNMTGYYYLTSYTGENPELYYNQSGISCAVTTCGNTAYKLIQSNDAEDIRLWNYTSSNSNYYYMVTRDTNILVLSSVTLATFSSINIPVTITGAYDDRAYNPSNGGTIKITANSGNNGRLIAKSDVVIENMKITTYEDKSDSSSTVQSLYANYYNVKIGRNVVAADDRKYTLTAVIGGSNTGDATNKVGKVIVESGKYYNLNTYNSSYTITDGHMIMQYGSDYDRVSGNNQKLVVDYRVSAAFISGDRAVQLSDTVVPASEIIIKSGTYGNYIFENTGGYTDRWISYQEYGVSAGTRNNGTTALNTLKVEGGKIFSVYGGFAGKNGNAIKISVTGGIIDNIVGGSAASDTKGNRIISVTGGKVNNAIAGGSNGYIADNKASADESNLDGDTLIYVGGNAHIGGIPSIIDKSPEESNGNISGMLFAVKPGSIFGASLSNARLADNKMTVNNSNIIINGGTVEGDVYGGGNYGSTGTKTDGAISTNIDIHDGNIEGNIYGGSNKNGFAKEPFKDSSSININMYGGTVNSIFGGSNDIGNIYGTVNINLVGGIVKSNVFGGGYGENTQVIGNVNVQTNTSNNSNLNVNNIYGGSSNGQVNVKDGNYDTNVTINGGTIIGSVYGAGEGSVVSPKTYGNIRVEIKNGIVNEVFGGNNISGSVPELNKNMDVLISGGTINNVYGGSNGVNASAIKTNIKMTGGIVNEALYGGGNEALTNGNSNIEISGGRFKEGASIYGGGYSAIVNNSVINLLDGASVYNVYGGSNHSGKLRTTTINANGGEIVCNLYGGGNEADVDRTYVNLNGTKFTYSLKDGETIYSSACGKAFGGGNNADVNLDSNVVLDGSSAISIYGGSNHSGDNLKSILNIKSGTAQAIFGGNNLGGSMTESFINIKEETGKSLILENVFGGNNAGGVTVKTNIDILSGQINGDVFGGGNQASVNNSTKVNMYGGSVRSLYGGGNLSYVGQARIDFEGKFLEGVKPGSTEVNVVSGTINKNVYGSGNASFVYGNTNVNIANSALNNENINNDYVVSNDLIIKGSIFGGSETNSSEDKQYDYKYNGVEGNSTINIDGLTYRNDSSSSLNIEGSVYGSGNNSAVSGDTNLYLSNFGVKGSPVTFTSLQRFKYAYVTDSFIELNGDRDRTNEQITKYSLIQIDNLYILGSKETGKLNGTEMYLRSGSTFLRNLYSGTMDGINKPSNYLAQKASKDENGEFVLENSNNKIYMYTNRLLSVSNAAEPDESNNANSAGSIRGMTFLGMYTHPTNGPFITGIYSENIENNQPITEEVYNEISLSAYTYVYGKKDAEPEVQVTNNGFYTNFTRYDSNISGYRAYLDYVDVTPKNGYTFYKWEIGDKPSVMEVDLIADRYSVYGAKNATINLDELKETLENEQKQSWRDARVNILDIDTSEFGAYKPEVKKEYNTYLIDKSKINSYNFNVGDDGIVDANQYFALSMGTSSSGWLDNYKTNFYNKGESLEGTDNFCSVGSGGDCVGDSYYFYDSSANTRDLSFWLYYSKNLDFSVAEKKGDDKLSVSLGSVTINTEFFNPHADPTDATRTRKVNIVVRIYMVEGDSDSYGYAIAPGKKYEVFQDSSTSIPTNGSFSIYQSLYLDLDSKKLKNDNEYWSVDEVYGIDSYRVLNSSYMFPVGTRITMLDLVTKQQYYYTVDEEDVKNQYSGNSTYRLNKFIKMGSENKNDTFDEDMCGEDSSVYRHSVNGKNLAVEEFIFTVDFSGVDPSLYTTEVLSPVLYMTINKTKNGVDNVIISPTGDPTRDKLYKLYPDVNSDFKTEGWYVGSNGSLSKDTSIYVDGTANLRLTTSLLHRDINGNLLPDVTNTTFDDYKLGAKMTILKVSKDSDGNEIREQLSDNLLGTVVSINGNYYYPQTDGSIRIKLAGKFTDLVSTIKLDFSNSELSAGDYIVVIETFGSYDGRYYGNTDINTNIEEFPLRLMNNQYGIEVNVDSTQTIHDVNTGLDKNGNQEISYNIKTKNGLANPNIKISLQRRDYNDYYDMSYTDIDLSDIATEVRFNNKEENALNSCFNRVNGDVCSYYDLGSISTEMETSNYTLILKLKNGPTEEEKLNPASSSWKSGTYKVVFTIFDGDTQVGSVYEYLIIRSLGVNEEIERSAN